MLKSRAPRVFPGTCVSPASAAKHISVWHRDRKIDRQTNAGEVIPMNQIANIGNTVNFEAYISHSYYNESARLPLQAVTCC